MIRWLLIILFIYLLYLFIKGPRRRQNGGGRFQFRIFQQGERHTKQNTKNRIESIEDAEFEDITDKEKKAGKE